MARPIYRLFIIFFITYATFVGGVVESDPLMKVVHQIGSALLLGGWLVSLWVRRKGLPKTWLDGPLWALGFAWLLSSVFSHNSRVSLEYLWPIFVHILLFYFFVDLIRSGYRRWIMEGLFITACVVLIIGFLEMASWYFGLPPFQASKGWFNIGGWSIPPVLHELSLPFGHNNPAGGYGLTIIPVALAWGNTLQRRDLRWGFWGLAAGLTVYVFFTQSRGAYLGFVALVGISLLIWLIRPDVRLRFPTWLRPLIAPKLLIGAAVVTGIIAVAILVQTIILPDIPNPNDVSRLDLWVSAVHMFRDHPLFGVGLRQFQETRLNYLNWQNSTEYFVLQHAHNALFQLIAEGGIAVLAATIAVVVRFCRMWRQTWKAVPDAQKRRLEAVLVALIAFSVHNMVDVFLGTQLMMGVIILAAYTVTAGDPLPGAEPVDAKRPAAFRQDDRRRALLIASVVLVIFQIGYVPVRRGALAYRHAVSLIREERYSEALTSVRAAEAADPWFDVYGFQAANLLGLLAAESPQAYLDQAIDAYEKALAPKDVNWESGWRDLAALYAQAGRYQDAIAAEQNTFQWSPTRLDNQFKLGEYYELAGDNQSAREIYLSLLARAPWLASSPFWKDEDFPERRSVLSGAVDQAESAGVRLSLAVYSGDPDLLREVSVSLGGDPDMASSLAILWPTGAETPCIYCYYVSGNGDLLAAELILHKTNLTSADLEAAAHGAQQALFVGESNAPWGWYILARVEEQQGGNSDTINTYLERATVIPSTYYSSFDDAYGIQGMIELLPQASAPMAPRLAYVPWLERLERAEQAGDQNKAERMRADILKLDPYAFGVE